MRPPVVDTGIRLRINALATKSALWDVGRRCNLYKECFRLKGRPRHISESTIDGSVSCVCVCVGGGGGGGAHVSRTQISELALNDCLNVTREERKEKENRKKKKKRLLFSRILFRLPLLFCRV